MEVETRPSLYSCSLHKAVLRHQTVYKLPSVVSSTTRPDERGDNWGRIMGPTLLGGPELARPGAQIQETNLFFSRTTSKGAQRSARGPDTDSRNNLF